MNTIVQQQICQEPVEDVFPLVISPPFKMQDIRPPPWEVTIIWQVTTTFAAGLAAADVVEKTPKMLKRKGKTDDVGVSLKMMKGLTKRNMIK